VKPKLLNFLVELGEAASPIKFKSLGLTPFLNVRFAHRGNEAALIRPSEQGSLGGEMGFIEEIQKEVSASHLLLSQVNTAMRTKTLHPGKGLSRGLERTGRRQTSTNSEFF
ncbi:MAG: hypothetical protein ACXWFO_06495, partial [Candidatus Aminicenantales bacterium]